LHFAEIYYLYEKITVAVTIVKILRLQEIYFATLN